MTAIICMTMIGSAAQTVIDKVSGYDQGYSGYQYPEVIIMK